MVKNALNDPAIIAKRKKQNEFYKLDKPKLIAYLDKKDPNRGIVGLNKYQKSFIMKRSWAAVDGREDEYPYTSIDKYCREIKPELDERAAKRSKRAANKRAKEKAESKPKKPKAK